MSEAGEDKDKNDVNLYARYSGIGFQMLAIIIAGVFGGKKLDQWVGFKFPIFTLVLTLVSVALAMYVVIKEFLKK